jgi:hypothetical protein
MVVPKKIINKNEYGQLNFYCSKKNGQLNFEIQDIDTS